MIKTPETPSPLADANNGARHLSTRWLLFCVWFFVGLAFIGLDSTIQPWLTRCGRTPVTRVLAEHWQELGATWGIVAFLLVGLATVWWDRGRTLIVFGTYLGVATVVEQLAKHMIGRARPNAVNDQTVFFGPLGMLNHGPHVQADSMPSGHTTAAFAMATALAWRWPRWAVLWYFLAAGVGVARTLVDRHFPADVIVGAWLGTIIGLLAWRWLSVRVLRPGVATGDTNAQ